MSPIQTRRFFSYIFYKFPRLLHSHTKFSQRAGGDQRFINCDNTIMSPYKLTGEDWEAAMLKLRDRHKSILVHGLLKNLSEGKWTGFEVWTDSWPEFKSIIAKPSGEEELDPYSGKLYFVDSDDVASMTSLLDNTRIITWMEDMNIMVPETVVPLLKQRGRGSFQCVGRASIYTVSRDSLKHVSPPEGYSVEKMDSDAIRHVTKHWKYSVPGLDQYVMQLLERGFPSVCFRDPTGELAAYVVTQFFNTPGMLHTLPKFRGQGLGSAVTSILANKMLETEHVVALLIDDDNPISQHLLQKIGFKPVPNSRVQEIACTVNDRT